MKYERSEGAFHILTPRASGQVFRQLDEVENPPSWSQRNDNIMSRLASPSRVYEEAGQQYTQRHDVLDGSIPLYSSYGLSAPSYIEALRQCEPPLGRPHRSLLIGALTPDTVVEYASSVRSVFPDAQALVVDIEGEKTPHTAPDLAQFVFGSGTNLPFADNTVDSIHTNYLWHMIKDTAEDMDISHSHQSNLRTLLVHEMYRVLAPNGKVIMVEGDQFREEISQSLLGVGLENLSDKRDKQFLTRIDMDNYFRSTAEVPLPETTADEKIMRVYTARKGTLGKDLV